MKIIVAKGKEKTVSSLLLNLKVNGRTADCHSQQSKFESELPQACACCS
jgi:hypothetical protein